MAVEVAELERVRGRLTLIRAQLDLELDALDALIARAAPAGCEHRNRVEVTAMGATTRTFQCRDCGELVTEPITEA